MASVAQQCGSCSEVGRDLKVTKKHWKWTRMVHFGTALRICRIYPMRICWIEHRAVWRAERSGVVLAKTDAARLHGKGNCAGPGQPALAALRPANTRLRATCPHWPKAPPPSYSGWRHRTEPELHSNVRERAISATYALWESGPSRPHPSRTAFYYRCITERGTWSEAGYWTGSISLAQWHVYGSTNPLHVYPFYYARCTSGFSRYAITLR